MSTTLRSAGSRVNHVIGPMVMLIGVAAGIAAIVLALALEALPFLVLFVPAALAVGGGAFVLWGARRSRLLIDETGFTWAGFVGRQHAVRWDTLHRLLPPPPGASRVVAIAELRDGSSVEVRALWDSPTSPSALLGASDHSAARDALIAAHREWLSTRS
ncbi:hypothetical protein ACFQS2_16500 [Brachybacterium sp. GCM10030267]|uniref:hypothetical protein n=1 Tax=Brachybacterium sp. GCM10030267 TaxID=3273381 RepID=UPI00360A84D8